MTEIPTFGDSVIIVLWFKNIVCFYEVDGKSIMYTTKLNYQQLYFVARLKK